MRSLLIKDTTREEREAIVAESIGDTSGSCEGMWILKLFMNDKYVYSQYE